METDKNTWATVRKDPPYLKCYSSLLGAFKPAEIIFMMYMDDLNRLREKGYRTPRGKRAHMAATNLGLRTFEGCVAKMTCMGLLEQRFEKGACTVYFWEPQLYARLVRILHNIGNVSRSAAFCRQFFDAGKRSVSSITDEEVERWKGGMPESGGGYKSDGYPHTNV